MSYFFFIVTILIMIYLFFVVNIQLILSLAGLKKKNKSEVGYPITKHRYAILIPAYKEDKVIVNTVEKVLEQDYPAHLFQIVVIADSLQRHTLDILHRLPIAVVLYAEENRTKTKALRKAIQHLNKKSFDGVVILDADNRLDAQFLKRSDQHFAKGHQVIQGQRTAANIDTPTAMLDAVGEAVNHNLFCKGATQLNLSARLMGSGMVFRWSLFEKLITQLEAVGGFDKALELELTLKGVRIYYAVDAIVYDEKVRSHQVFQQQRKRWISAQYFYLRKYFKSGVQSFLKGDKRDFVFKVALLALPPRLILPPVLLVLCLLSYLMAPTWVALSFFGLTIAHFLSLFWAIPRKYFKTPYRKAWWSLIPLTARTVKLLFTLKHANQRFIHTPHGETTTTSC